MESAKASFTGQPCYSMPDHATSARMFSRRTAHDTATNALTRALTRARAAGSSILDLTVSNPTSAGIPYDDEAILRALADPRALHYAPEPFGLPHAREAVARDLREHGAAIDASRVILTASTSEAYAFLFKLLCDPGDRVLVPAPSYPLFEHLAAFECVELVPYALAYDGEWHVDLDEVRRAAASTRERARAILVVNPNNPTGSYVKRAELDALAELGLPIVSDEVFARYALTRDPRRVTSVLEGGGALSFALGGLSKLAALPQMKAAWIAVGGDDARVAEALSRLELVADSFLSVSTPIQHALPSLLTTRSVAEDAIVRRTRANLDRLRALVTRESAATLLHVEGGWYATLRLPRTQSEESWVIELLEKDHVYVHPGHFFDFRDEAHVIVSLLTPETPFADGAARLLARVHANA
jgi:alanine-synthesizing transaminase